MTFDWSQIEKFYDQGNTAGYLASVLASEKLLRSVLKEKNYPGATWEEKIDQAKQFLSAPQMLDQSRTVTRQILNLNLPNAITQNMIEQILKSYFTAITELANLDSFAISKSRFTWQARRFQKAIGKFIFYIFVAAVMLVVGAWFLTKTGTGQNISNEIQDLSNLIIYKALPIFLGVIVLTAIGVAYAVNRKNSDG